MSETTNQGTTGLGAKRATELEPDPRRGATSAERLRPSTLRPQSSAWDREINKLIGRKITVTQFVGTSREGLPLYLDHVGVCIAVQFQHLAIVLATDDEKLVLRNVASIRRPRSKNNPPKPPADPIAELADVTQKLSDVLGEALKGAPK